VATLLATRHTALESAAQAVRTQPASVGFALCYATVLYLYNTVQRWQAYQSQ